MAGELTPYKKGPMDSIIEAAGMLSTYIIKDRAQAVALYKAMQGADFGLDDLAGEVIEVEHIVSHRSQMLDKETGEIVYNVRTVLIGPDGTRYATRSNTVRADLERACLIFGMEFPMRPPMRFKVVLTKSREGTRKYLQLVPEVFTDAEGQQ